MIPKDEQPYPLPDGWQWTPLKEVAEIIMGQSPKGDSTTKDSSFTPLIGGASDIGKIFPKVSRYTKKPIKLSEPGDVIICVRATLGNPVFSDKKYCLGRGVAAIRPRSIKKIFLRYLLIKFEQYFHDKATGSTFDQVSSTSLKNFPVPLPPLDEQQRIVELLDDLFDKLDEVKALAQAVVDGSELRRAAILHKAFTGELTELWRDEHGTTLDSWENCLLGDVCKINPPKISTQDLLSDLEVSFVPMAAVSAELGEITEPQKKTLGEVKSGFTNFSEGDVLFAKITPCMENGKSAMVEKLINQIGYGSTEFFVLRCGDKLFNKFVYHLVRGKLFRGAARAVMSGSVGQERVPKNFLIGYQLNLPPLNEQKEIVRILDDLLGREQKIKDLAGKTLERVEMMQKSILAQAFHGEFRSNEILRYT